MAITLRHLAAAAAASADCFPDYQCIFHWIDSKRTQEYSWDLGPLCGDDINYTYITPQGWTWSIIFTVCGNVSYGCYPNWPSVVSHGVAIQSWTDSSTPVGSPTTDPETGATVPMTYPCEVLGHDRPVMDVIDPLNPRAGLVLTHSALPPTASDPNGCLPDPRTGYPKERELKIFLACDPGVAKTTVAVDSFIEAKAGTCQYELHLRSGAGCGSYGDPYDLPYTPTTTAGTPGNNFGYTVLGVCLSIAFVYGAQWADARGYMEGVPKPIRALLPVKDKGAGMGMGMGGMSVASSTATGSTGSEGSPFSAKAAYGSL